MKPALKSEGAATSPKPARRKAGHDQEPGRRRLAEALRASQERYRRIVETTHEGIWMADLDGVTTFANPQIARMLGCTVEEMVGRPVFEFVFEEDHAAVRQHFEQFLAASAGQEVEERLRRKDGTELWALVAANVLRNECGQPEGFLGMFSELTRRKQMETTLRRNMQILEKHVRQRTAALSRSDQALAEGEANYRRLFEAISDAVLVFDGKTRRLVEVNEAALRLYGYTREEFLHLDFNAITTQPEETESTIRLALSGETVRIPLRYHRKKDGAIFPVEISGSAFTHQGRAMLCGIMRDITRRQRAEEALRRNRELEREILAIGEQERQRLGQDLHDDLCQQLAGISFLSERLAGKLAALGVPAAAQANEITRLLQQAMNQTHELARGLSPVRLGPDGLTEALHELAAGTRMIFGRNCRFRQRQPVVALEPGTAYHLFRITQEAIGNAVKHGRARSITIELSSADGLLRLTVRDNGIGLPPESPNGKGLGLRTMRYRAETIGGILTVQRRLDGGTLVECVVPQKREQP